jgi:hypothetical protein
MKILNYILFFITIVLLYSCDLFSTRTPETPNAARNNFKTPNTADIVIDNFIFAINEKSTDNYLSCLSDTVFGGHAFIFIPSAEAVSKFPEIFNSWDRLAEYRVFQTILKNLKANQNTNLIFKNGDFDTKLPDSAIYITDYVLTVPHNTVGFPTEFSGSLQFILKHDDNSLWSITQWTDISKSKDSSVVSWSTLKANFTK